MTPGPACPGQRVLETQHEPVGKGASWLNEAGDRPRAGHQLVSRPCSQRLSRKREILNGARLAAFVCCCGIGCLTVICASPLLGDEALANQFPHHGHCNVAGCCLGGPIVSVHMRSQSRPARLRKKWRRCGVETGNLFGVDQLRIDRSRRSLVNAFWSGA